MKKERKYTGTELAKALTTSHYHNNGYNHVFTCDDIMTLVYGWTKHPKYPSPDLNTIRMRNYKHGEFWLSESEIPSFASYVGYKLLKYLD